MRKDTVFTIVAGLIFIGGIGFYYFSQTYRAHKRAESEQIEQLDDPGILPVSPDFNPLSNEKESFEAEMTTNPGAEGGFNAHIQYDGKGNARVDAKQNGEFTEFYLTPTEHIFCQLSECFSTIPDTSEPLFDISTFVYKRGDLADLGRGLVKSGEEPCQNSICDVWTTPTPVDIAAPRILIDQNTRQIVHISGDVDNEQLDIEFTYKPINIIFPVNVQKL